MADSPQLPPRPIPPRRLGDLAGAWLSWLGLGRLVTTACCVLIVGAGAYWLVRAPAPAPEADLPFAAAAGTTPPTGRSTPTLPPPVAGASTAQVGRFVVHVAGAVRSPGVYELGQDDRVLDAVAAAGGASVDADLEGLNLAAPIADGVRIYVPVAGEIDPASVPSGFGVDGVESAPSGPVDLNRGTSVELEALPGVGPATAAAIIDDRERNGPFASVDDLDRVPGIGPAKLAALRDLVTV
jgi:competence protein ComEA